MRHFIGLPGLLHRLPLIPPDGADADEYAQHLEGQLQAGTPATVRVTMQGHQVDLRVNPAALMWWYLASEPEQPVDAVDAQWPAPTP
jgi:hypothetical protein